MPRPAASNSRLPMACQAHSSWPEEDQQVKACDRRQENHACAIRELQDGYPDVKALCVKECSIEGTACGHRSTTPRGATGVRASPRAATGGPSSPLACRGSGAPPGVWRCAAGWSAPSRAAGCRHHLPVLASESGSSVSVAPGKICQGKKS